MRFTILHRARHVGTFFAGALLLAACAAGTVELTSLQTDTALDAAYNTALTGYLKVAANLPTAVHDRIKTDLKKAYPIIQACDAGQLLAGQATMAAQIGAANALIADANTSLSPTPS